MAQEVVAVDYCNNIGFSDEEYDTEEEEEKDKIEEDTDSDKEDEDSEEEDASEEDDDDSSEEDDEGEGGNSDKGENDTDSDSVQWESEDAEDDDIDAYDPKSEERALQNLPPRLLGHQMTLPPYAFQRARKDRSAICNGKAGNLGLITTGVLRGGNGATTLRLVHVIEVDALGRAEKEKPYENKVWVLKRFDLQGRRTDIRQRALGMAQMSAERDVYSRIAAMPSNEKAGVDFLMWMGASLTIDSYRCLLMPKMASDLGKWLKEVHAPPQEDIRRIIAQCVMGLAALHHNGVIHGDMKPGNVFLDARMNVKIGDFGGSYISKKIRPLKRTVGYGKAKVGTEGYMAPEMFNEPRRYSYQVDYWSLGIIFLEMSVGHDKFLVNLSEELMPKWAKNNKLLSERTQYCLRRSSTLNTAELEVLCGLLDPCPWSRMEVEHLLSHRYFEVDGVSEFDRIGEKALLRPSYNVSESEKVCKWPYVCVSTHSDVPGPWEWLNPSLYKAT